MPEPLSPIERKVYNYLLDFLAENTYQPSIREIGKKFRIKSTKTVSDVLHGLARKGFIERDPSRSRGVRLVGYTGVGGTTALPYYAGVASSEQPVDPSARVGHLVIDRRLASERAYMIRVQGDGNVTRCVHDGDYVVIDPSAVATEGALVAVREGTGVAIRALGAADNAQVAGVVTTVIRSFAPPTSDPIAQPIVSQTTEVS